MITSETNLNNKHIIDELTQKGTEYKLVAVGWWLNSDEELVEDSK